MADGNELDKAIFVMLASPNTPASIRTYLEDARNEPTDEKALRLEEAFRKLPPGTFESYTEVERSQITIGVSEAELLGY